jgi:hypothetical protein
MTAGSLLAGFLCFCAGVLFHMSVLHFFCFERWQRVDGSREGASR